MLFFSSKNEFSSMSIVATFMDLELHECKPTSTSLNDKMTVNDVFHVSFCYKNGGINKKPNSTHNSIFDKLTVNLAFLQFLSIDLLE